jgi:hypothetical protein
MNIENLRTLKLLIKLSEKAGNYKLADSIVNKVIRLAQETEVSQQFTKGTELQPGTTYEVPTTDSSIFDKVAQSGVPDYANVGGEKVLVTHGSSDGMWLVPDSVASNFFNNNPDFKQNGQVGESDGGAGIQATFEQGKNRLWLNAQGMQKYAGAKWLGCYDLISGKGFGTFGGSKDPIQVITQSSPEGQKTFLKAGN